MKKIPLSTVLIFLFASLVYAVGAATRAGVPGMVFDQIRESLHITAAETSGISSAGVFGCMAFLGISGLLIDRFGWRKVILAGIVLQVAGEWLLYTFTQLPVIYAGAFLNGGGRTIGYLTLLKFLDTEFDRKYFSVLIGVFYIFSYGGTLLGSSPFESLAADHSWQTVLRWANHLTTACGVAVAFCMIASARPDRKTKTGEPRVPARPFPWKELLVQLKKPQCLCVFYCAASGIVIYWSCLSVFGKKYLSDLCGADASAIGVMNTLVMIEMIFAGSVSYLCGNRRKIFQLAGCALLAAGCAVLFGGTCLNSQALAHRTAWAGFLLLGAGYGFTCIQITACREFVPPEFAASAIAFVNFCANILIITLSQVAGSIFDKFKAPDSLQATPRAFGIILGICLALAVPAAIATRFLPDSRGRNISSEL
jgi:MFS family permease